jgi:hypothetical protein
MSWALTRRPGLRAANFFCSCCVVDTTNISKICLSLCMLLSIALLELMCLSKVQLWLPREEYGLPANILILKCEMRNTYFTGRCRLAIRNAAFLSLFMYHVYQENVGV